MKALLTILSLFAALWVLSPVLTAHAMGSSHPQTRHGSQTSSGHSTSHGVPELDPGAAGGAMVLMLGGVAYLASRRRPAK
jgi:hypothetical protein